MTNQEDTDKKWFRQDLNGSILIYTVKEHRSLRGKTVLVSDLTIRIENANGSQHDLGPIADNILAILSDSPLEKTGSVSEADKDSDRLPAVEFAELIRLREALTIIRDKKGQCNRAADCRAVARTALKTQETEK